MHLHMHLIHYLALQSLMDLDNLIKFHFIHFSLGYPGTYDQFVPRILLLSVILVLSNTT